MAKEMSRELKFRIYDKTSGYYVAILDNDCFDIKQVARIILELEMLKHEYIIAQYTGLLDKNGKEIYEGDILETCCGKAEVYFDIELFMYRLYLKHGNTMPLVSKKSNRHLKYEVIGNVHEN